MLSGRNRLRRSSDFGTTIRHGRRRGSRTVIVHLLAEGQTPTTGSDTSVRVGFVVSKAVGNAVVRNRVKRRLRHVVRTHVAALPKRGTVVLRATPAAADAGYAAMEEDVKRCFARLTKDRAEG